MLTQKLRGAYSVLLHYVKFILLISFLTRLALLIWSFPKAQLGIAGVLKIFALGLIYDFGVAIFLVTLYSVYLLLWPSKWNNSRINKIITYTAFFLTTLIVMFSFFAEFTFWEEFESRFNFIAVDYLIYTYEVVNNINQSYPLPYLIGGMVLLTILITYVFIKRKYFREAFEARAGFAGKLALTGTIIVLAIIYSFWVSNYWADSSRNRYQNELSKAGIYSFFSAFKNNELNYDQFYLRIRNEQAFDLVKKDLADSSAHFEEDPLSIHRTYSRAGVALKPNVIMITIESFSADFMTYFGNKSSLTPFLDSLALKSLLFTNLYSTGTRTVRGMEALTLAIPPTPGSSIVRRPDNDHLTTIGHIFRQNGYKTGFFYGGDGYFDNMNMYFGNNGYTVYDRGRDLLRDRFESDRIRIDDSLVSFENAWGICDENLYDVVIRQADSSFARNEPFYDFVMTTSNHRPYTYPSGKIDIPSGSGRDGAVKYTDYAIRQFFQKASSKPWFKNTIIILVADHCASSAGKNEIDVSKYHIPAMVYNLPSPRPDSIQAVCSQIDIYPTLFNLMNWTYQSNLFGKNVLDSSYIPRTFVGTYQKLAYLKNDRLVILSPQEKAETYIYKKDTNEQVPVKADSSLIREAVGYYQSAYYLFKNEKLKYQTPGNK